VRQRASRRSDGNYSSILAGMALVSNALG
jgi:hypothetical protein